MAWGAGGVIGPIATAIRRRVFGNKQSVETYLTSVDVAPISTSPFVTVVTTPEWLGLVVAPLRTGGVSTPLWAGPVVGGD